MQASPTLFLSLSLILLGVAAPSANAQNKPNVVYILVDNWGWGDIPAKAKFDSRTTARTIEFIRANAKEGTPFYTYVGFTHFHPPWGVHPDFTGKSGAGIYADTKSQVYGRG